MGLEVQIKQSQITVTSSSISTTQLVQIKIKIPPFFNLKFQFEQHSRQEQSFDRKMLYLNGVAYPNVYISGFFSYSLSGPRKLLTNARNMKMLPLKCLIRQGTKTRM